MIKLFFPFYFSYEVKYNIIDNTIDLLISGTFVWQEIKINTILR